ncbi:hypothetical protein [Streptomyces avermitilis]
MGTWHVTMQFRPGGPAVEGTWTDHEVALEKFRGWLGNTAAVTK